MLRIWICLLALVSQACLAMEVSPHFSRQLEPVMKLYQSGQWQQAQNKATGLKPGSDAERAWLAQLQASLAANLQQTAQASRYVEQALAYKEWPEQQLQLLRLRGDIQAQQSNWSGAIASYKAALALKSDDALRLRLAGLYYHNKQYGEAVSQSEQLLKKGWHKQTAIIRLSALTALQRYGVAAEQAEELIRHEPKESKWWQQAVSLNLSAKRGDQALALLQTAIDRKLMDDAAARNQLIRLYAWQGLPYRGARLLEAAMAKGQMKGSAENQQLLAQLWEGAREWPKAVDSWQQLAKQHAQPKAAMRVAELLLQQGKTEAAMTQLVAMKSAKGEQGNRAKALLVQAHLNKEQYAQALELARELQQQDNWQQRATSWVNYIQAQTDGVNKKAA
ncbi:tetratricopeptide repeat protein [Aeromonas media]|uniref:tetratricopeptide repeat protein n=1 Tax=Aeromonas media TaxID=651 RepID=UPI00223FDD38|nr:tetratricopeptide repeat protein [Aeromonas media]